MSLLALWLAFLFIFFVDLFASEVLSKGFPSVWSTPVIPILQETWMSTRDSILCTVGHSQMPLSLWFLDLPEQTSLTLVLSTLFFSKSPCGSRPWWWSHIHASLLTLRMQLLCFPHTSTHPCMCPQAIFPSPKLYNLLSENSRDTPLSKISWKDSAWGPLRGRRHRRSSHPGGFTLVKALHYLSGADHEDKTWGTLSSKRQGCMEDGRTLEEPETWLPGNH